MTNNIQCVVTDLDDLMEPMKIYGQITIQNKTIEWSAIIDEQGNSSNIKLREWDIVNIDIDQDQAKQTIQETINEYLVDAEEDEEA